MMQSLLVVHPEGVIKLSNLTVIHSFLIPFGQICLRSASAKLRVDLSVAVQLEAACRGPRRRILWHLKCSIAPLGACN